ncbi:MAG: hypothetical protein JSS59_14815 [Proteobacteria bacterium]|uniref:hypothetical protein n=1 Tax=Rudaea sp. TaxID=2136325 RepID=UPI0037849BAB|nr:hypothetical protein [Pseudomonadota bacterium]
MMTKISMAEDADSWCRRLGNFAPIVYRPAPAMAGAGRDPFASARSGRPLRAPVPARQRGATAQLLLGAIVATAAMLPWPVTAQMQGGGMGGHGGGGHGRHGDRPSDMAQKSNDASPQVPDPLAEMLVQARELRAELLLGTDQIGPWSAMEDALRECVEFRRARPRRDGSDVPADAQRLVQDLADEQRQLADAEARLAATTKAAFAVLNPRQARTSNERFTGALAAERGSTAALP